MVVLLWQVRSQALFPKEESVEEILKDLYYGAAKKIQEEASRWAGVVRND